MTFGPTSGPTAAMSNICPVLWDKLFRRAGLAQPTSSSSPMALHNCYGDRRVLEENYDTMRRWMLTPCACKGPPARSITTPTATGATRVRWASAAGKTACQGQTSLPLIATAYFCNNCNQLARIAGLLGKADDEKRFAELGRKAGEAFQRGFFDPQSNTYESKTQCSCILPLAFGLVPEARREAVAANLAGDIMVTQPALVGRPGRHGLVHQRLTGWPLGRGLCRDDPDHAAELGLHGLQGPSGLWERWLRTPKARA